MIPVSLTFKGIYSYQEEQSIDFERLSGAQLFGIFGSVGSGKSTILEAIAFALYGETERLGARDNRGYNMMNLKSDELCIEFVFKAGKNNTDKYKFVVNGKRNSKRFEEVKTFTRCAYIKKKNDWEPIDDDSAEDILGLSYQNFRRAIIIPQGKFQEFLKLKSTERTQMLKEIFELEKYELKEKITAVKKANDFEIHDVDVRLDQIGEAGEEIIEKNEKALIKREKEAGEIEKNLKAKIGVRDEMGRIKKIRETVAEAEKAMEAFAREEPKFKVRTDKLNTYKKCKSNFRDLFDQKKIKEENIEEAEDQIADNKEQFKELDDERKTGEKSFKALEAKYEKKDEIISRANDLRRMIDIKNIEKKKEGIEKKLVSVESKLKVKQERLEGLKKEKDSVKKKLAEEKKKAPASADLLEVQEWFNDNEMIEKNIRDSEKDQKDTRKNIEAIEKEKSGLLKGQSVKIYFADKQVDRTFEKAPGILERALNDIKLEIKSLEKAIRPLGLRQQMSEAASELRKGEKCPLCGSEEHPRPLEPGDIERELEKKKGALGELYDNQSEAKETLNEIKGLYKQKNALEKEIKEEEIRYKVQLSERDAHIKAFKFKGFSPSDSGQFEEKKRENKAATAKITALDNTVNATEVKLEKAELDTREGLLEYEEAKKELNTAVVKTDTIKKEISDKIGTKDWKKESYEIEIEAKNIEKDLKVLGDEYAKKKKGMTSLYSSINELKGTIKTSEEVLKKDINDLKKTENAINDRLEKSGFKKMSEVETILSEEINEKIEGPAINKFWKDMELAKGDLDRAVKDAGTKKYDAKKHDKVSEEVEALNDDKDEVNQAIGELKNKIKEHKKNLSEKKRLEKKMKKLRTRAEDIKVLYALFRGNGFVNYVSTVYLQNFCRVANERFYKLTRQSMKLRLEENNDFCVQDFMNEGKTRNIKTLSGGELFQASLSLAVALSDSIQGKFGDRQNFFFLDEGFGSQDKDSLQDVFYALKTMRNENRIVGIISHVEGLQEEIDTHLKTHKDEDTGSHIKTSWEY